MKTRACFIPAARLSLGLALLLVATPALAQFPSAKTPEHEVLKKDVGTWDAKMKIYSSPDADPIESDGVETSELFGDGLWLLAEFKSKIGEMPFEGRSATGYDPVEKKYIATWIDTISPSFTTLTGEYDEETKTLTMIAEGRDMATGEMKKNRHVVKYVDDDTREFTMYAPGEDGAEEWKMLEVTYKRRK